MPNALAYLTLMLWPLVCLVLFRRLPVERALVWSILGGYLILPPVAEFNIPLFPEMDKTSIPNLSAFLICTLVMGERMRFLPVSKAGAALVLLYILCAVPTVLTNGDALIFRLMPEMAPITLPSAEIPGLRTRDLLSAVSGQIIVLLPFLMARHFLATERGLRELLWALVAAGVAYSFPALLEARLSPQLNIWIYGFFQHDWSQMVRGGGFRPLVFLPHAIWLAFFMMTALMAATVLTRTVEAETRPRLIAAMVLLAVVVLVCKTMASILYAAAMVPLILLARPGLQVALAASFALIAVLYPVVRNAHLVPVETLLDWAAAVSADRAQSLGFRFGNEEQLLARAAEKPLFGWGGWGRNLVRDEATLAIETIPDGRWIIVFGTFGWVGYIAEMGLLALPVALIAARLRRIGDVALARHAAALTLILAITLIDMLINATLIPFTWMIAGALLGYAERLAEQRAPSDVRPPLRAVMGRAPRTRGRRTIL